MRQRSLAAVAAFGLLTAATAAQAQETAFTFDKDAAGQPPAGFSSSRTGSGAQGKWIVRAEKDAPSAPNVLAQIDMDSTDYRFPIAVANAVTMKDGKVTVKCKPVSGRVDQACGVVVRYRDENNYYLARANALENNVNLYFVKDGKRREIKGHRTKVMSGAWHELSVSAQGDRLHVVFDGKPVIDVVDKTFADPGKIGVWTKADSVTYFDDLTVSAR